MAVSLTVGGWFAQGFIQTLIDKASDEAIQLFAKRQDFAEDMDKLRKSLRISLLETLIILDELQSSRSHNTEWKTLMRELKDTAYDAQDLIDEFQYHVLRQKIKGEIEEDKASGFFSSAEKMLFGPSHSWEEDDMRDRVRKIQERLATIANIAKDSMKVLPPNDRGKQPEVKFQARESCSSPVTDILFGREKELNQVVDWLLGSANQVEPASGFVNDTSSVLPIVGIGGVGKTTLAQHVHKDDRVQDHFHLKIWVCVYHNFTVQELTKSILQSIDPENQYENVGLEPLRKILHKHIAKKKFLLFLDDVWSDDNSIWENFCALLKVGAHGSKIIVTARDMKVSKMVSLGEPILLDGLDEDVFWQLFKKCSFGTLNPENYPGLADIGRKIAHKLKGSPLAAKTLGRVLQKKFVRQHWVTIMKSDIWKVKQDEHSIMPALHLSYQDLDDNLKQCFAFCSLFPKDYRFDKAELVQMWMAEGFIEDKNTEGMEDVGNDYFLEFVDRYFFKESKFGGFMMHDLIHDLAEMISAEETCRIENNRPAKPPSSTTRHLRVVEGKLPLEFSGYDKLRTLVLRNSPPDSLFEKLRSIRVLDVSRCGLQELSEHIGNLIHLRYLDISWNFEIKILPDSLCDLYNLQTLKVKYCPKLQSIPQELSKLVNLRHIDADCMFWVTIKDVRRLTNLQELPTFSVSEDDRHKLGQLKDLTQLRGTLRIYNLQDVVDSQEAKRAELKNKAHLEELKLKWIFNCEKDAKLEEEVIEGLQPHESLKILTISGYNGGRSPSWLMPKVLSNLEKLKLEDCKGWDDVRPFIGQDLFPCMRELRVGKCPELKRLPPVPPSLEILAIEDCPKLILNSNMEGGSHLPPSLKELELKDCGEYAELLTDCLHNLCLVTRLRIDHCPHITSIPPVQLVALQYLCISNCDELRRMERLGLLKSLKELKIVGCPRLVQLDVEDEQAGSLSSLRKLYVDNTALLKMFPLRNSLSFITDLTIESCSEEVIVEEEILMQSLTAVTSLSFSGCKKLQSLPTELLHCLPFLKELVIHDCPQIQAMPEPGFPVSYAVYCLGDVHPTLKEQSEKFMEMRRVNLQRQGGNLG